MAAIAGCNGSGRLEVLSLNTVAIDPPAPASYRFDPQRCYWWKNEDGGLSIAMQSDQSNWFSPLGKGSLKLSLVLKEMPAGRARNYSVGPREVRASYALGLWQHRFTSLRGIVGVSLEKDGRIKGAFRVWMLHHPGPGLFTLFPPSPGEVLFFGDLRAVRDNDGKGRRILAETESQGWDRKSQFRPTSRPADAILPTF